MKRALAPAFCLLLLCGCTGQAEKTMGGGEVFFYPELGTFDQEALLSVDYPAARKNWAEVKKAAKAKEFSAAVAKFEAAPIPSQYSDRQGAKDRVVAEAKALHDKATKNVPNEEFEAAYKSLTDALKALRGVEAAGA